MKLTFQILVTIVYGAGIISFLLQLFKAHLGVFIFPMIFLILACAALIYLTWKKPSRSEVRE